MKKPFDLKLSVNPVYDPGFYPAALFNKAFLEAVEKSGKGVPVAVGIERNDGLISVYKTKVFDESCREEDKNILYIERLVKALLWIKGGFRVIFGGPQYLGEYLKKAYAPGGLRAFDAEFMARVYDNPFEVVVTDYYKVPAENEKPVPAGRHMDGCRIGFDAGGSDRKVSAVIDGQVVYSEEVVWHPKINSDPDYHYEGIVTAFKTAASHMPRVDAIGVSSAGIYVNNEVKVASLFLKVPEDLFREKVRDIYIRAAKEIGDVPLVVANDGDVTALAGAMDLNSGNVLGIAMGTSEAGGYVDSSGNITGWLNELAFVPADYNPESMVDEWSGDYGCGVKYFSQDAVIKLAPRAGIELDENLSPAEKLKVVQKLNEQGDKRAEGIFRTIGCYLGYTLAHYASFYDIDHVLVLGRVTSGRGGSQIVETAKEVLMEEFPKLSRKIKLELPDESDRRVGQSIAAASLPSIK
ncbi:MAG TPA: ROK family protein [Clostridiaceae bacterium]|nr:ROK family protein [Clostridiaceae bacterium]